MIIRPARTEDAPAIAAIWNPLIRDTTVTFTSKEKTEAAIAALIAERGAGFLVATVSGAVVGFATHGPFRTGPGYARTAELTVNLAEPARGRGIGRALIEALETQARKAGLHVLVAGISADNAPAIAFHRALGYAETGRMPEVGHKFGRWLDLVLMQKTL